MGGQGTENIFDRNYNCFTLFENIANKLKTIEKREVKTRHFIIKTSSTGPSGKIKVVYKLLSQPHKHLRHGK